MNLRIEANASYVIEGTISFRPPRPRWPRDRSRMHSQYKAKRRKW